jgi:hypothetical protein
MKRGIAVTHFVQHKRRGPVAFSGAGPAHRDGSGLRNSEALSTAQASRGAGTEPSCESANNEKPDALFIDQGFR